MKTKKLKISLDDLVLNKETMFNLSKDQMKNLVGGVTEASNVPCHSVAGCSTDPLCSFATNCYSVCEPNCTGTGTDTSTCTIDPQCPITMFCN